MDLTTLQGDDTPGRVRRLCAKARRPVRADLLEALGAREPRHQGGRGVRLSRLRRDRRARRSRAAAFRWPRCAPGFRPGSRPFETRLREIELSVAAGAGGDRHRHHPRARAHRQLAGALRRSEGVPRRRAAPAHLKTILGTGELGTLRDVARASVVCMMAGADFIKTSTGQGSGQRDAAGRARHGAADPRLPRAHRASGSGSSPPAASAPPSSRSTGWR